MSFNITQRTISNERGETSIATSSGSSQSTGSTADRGTNNQTGTNSSQSNGSQTGSSTGQSNGSQTGSNTSESRGSQVGVNSSQSNGTSNSVGNQIQSNAGTVNTTSINGPSSGSQNQRELLHFKMRFKLRIDQTQSPGADGETTMGIAGLACPT